MFPPDGKLILRRLFMCRQVLQIRRAGRGNASALWATNTYAFNTPRGLFRLTTADISQAANDSFGLRAFITCSPSPRGGRESSGVIYLDWSLGSRSGSSCTHTKLSAFIGSPTAYRATCGKGHKGRWNWTPLAGVLLT